MRLYETRPQTVHEHLGVVTTDERRAELYVNLGNSGDTAIENLTVGVVSLPDGWSVTDVETEGRYRPEDRRLVWPSVAPGEEVDTTLVLTVPDGTPVGEYTVEVRAESDTHLVSAGPATVEVRPVDTPTPTPAPALTGDGTPPTTDPARGTPTPADPTTVTDARPTTTSAPGFGPATTATAIVVVAVLLARRR